MALLENLINVIVPLIICGLIFVYFRRRITNLEQSVDIMMKMIQTNELKEGHNLNESGNLYVPPSHENSLVETSKDEDSNSESDSDSESESESESDSEDNDSDSENNAELETTRNTVLTNNMQLHEEPHPNDEENFDGLKEESHQTGPAKLVVLNEDLNTENKSKNESILHQPSSDTHDKQFDKDDLEKKNLVDLKKLLKEANPSINNLSRMNKQIVIENLMNT